MSPPVEFPSRSTVGTAPPAGIGAPAQVARAGYLSCETSPRRTASAVAWPRLRTPSFRRIAPTWWPTVRSERTSRAAISESRRPSATSASTSSCARSQARRVLARRPPRAARQAPRAALAQPAGDDRRRRPRPEPLELVERPAELLLVAGVRAGERRLVRAAGLVPERGGARPSRRRAERRTAPPHRRDVVVDARPAAPEGQLAERAGVLLLHGEPERVLRRRGDAFAVARAASATSARAAATGAMRISLFGRRGQRPRLLEELLDGRDRRAARGRARGRRARRCAGGSTPGGSGGRPTAASAASSQRPWSSSTRAR